ncbi:MAG: type II secretion system protein [Candidatus Omnitrophota bacterium]
MGIIFNFKISTRSITLIELMVILSILVALVLAAIIKYMDLRNRVRDHTEAAIISSMRTAVETYYAKYLSWPDLNLFKLLSGPPDYIELGPLPCPRDGARWCTYKYDYDGNGSTPNDPWFIECPHRHSSGGVVNSWRYCAAQDTNCTGKVGEIHQDRKNLH